MQAIIDLLKSLVNGIVGLIQFITKMVDDLIYFINLLGELLPSIPSFLTWKNIKTPTEPEQLTAYNKPNVMYYSVNENIK